MVIMVKGKRGRVSLLKKEDVKMMKNGEKFQMTAVDTTAVLYN